MKLHFYNSLTRQLEVFKSIEVGKVRMYTCGPTVYDYAHIGNFRAYAFSDLICRSLKLFGYEVFRAMNITDVDDKTIRAANTKKVGLKDFTEPFTQAFFSDLEKLRMLPADVYPRATDHVAEMISMIETLEKKGHAYRSEGSVYFRLSSFADYGKLMNLSPEDLLTKASSRMKSDEYEKEQISDFVLWKAYEEIDGSVKWDSPFGPGRPGWHIECSAMSEKYLGRHFDIHTGGMDNKFPHHENEIAQSECCHESKFVNVWLHCSHLLVDNKKMSKSLGNFYTLRDLLEKGLSAKGIRYLLLATHYRNFLNFTLDGVRAGEKAIERVNLFLASLRKLAQGNAKGKSFPALEEKAKAFKDALADDLNTSGALGAVFELIQEVRERGEDFGATNASEVLDFFKQVNSIFDVFDVEEPTSSVSEDFPEAVLALLAERQKAREQKKFQESDRLRDQLKSLGYLVKDSKDGQKLEKIS
jgi:cysteinyl-tRNA synthetase